MDNARKVNLDLEALAWGMLMIWWGLRWWPLESLPNGTGLVGTGLILLVLNAIRLLKGVPARNFTTLLGVLALAFGGMLLANSILQFSFELRTFEVILIVFGAFLFVRAFKKPKTKISSRA